MNLVSRFPAPDALLASLLIALPGLAMAQTATPGVKKEQAVTAAAPKAAPVKVAKAAPSTKKALTPEQRKIKAVTAAAPAAPAEPLNAEQLAMADRVLTGTAACEFSQAVDVKPVSGQPGHFHVNFKGASYLMTPEETTTGAVRLADKRQGVVWIQIPAKSMMLNQKVGRRMVDSCQHAEQRAAAEVANAAPALIQQ